MSADSLSEKGKDSFAFRTAYADQCCVVLVGVIGGSGLYNLDNLTPV